MKFKLDVDLDHPVFEGDVTLGLASILQGVRNWVMACSSAKEVDGVWSRVLPHDETGASSTVLRARLEDDELAVPIGKAEFLATKAKL